MKVKLTPIVNVIKDKYTVEVEFMHGDADAYTSETYECKDEADFIRVMTRLEDVPEDPGAGGDEDVHYSWCEETFGGDSGFVPRDCTCDDYQAAIRNYEGYYYNAAGDKFEATLKV